MESSYCSDNSNNIDEAVQNAIKLLQNAQSRYDTEPMKARYGLEVAERILDIHLIQKHGATRDDPNNPHKDLFDKIMEGWEYLNSQNP